MYKQWGTAHPSKSGQDCNIECINYTISIGVSRPKYWGTDLMLVGLGSCFYIGTVSKKAYLQASLLLFKFWAGSAHLPTPIWYITLVLSYAYLTSKASATIAAAIGHAALVPSKLSVHWLPGMVVTWKTEAFGKSLLLTADLFSAVPTYHRWSAINATDKGYCHLTWTFFIIECLHPIHCCWADTIGVYTCTQTRCTAVIIQNTTIVSWRK